MYHIKHACMKPKSKTCQPRMSTLSYPPPIVYSHAPTITPFITTTPLIKINTRNPIPLTLTLERKRQMTIPNPQNNIILCRIVWPTPPPPSCKMSRFVQVGQVRRYCAEADDGWFHSGRGVVG